MKSIFLILSCIILYINAHCQAQFFKVYYASCDSPTGHIVYDFFGSSADSAVWSTGETGWAIYNVPPGSYSMVLYYNGVANPALHVSMYHQTWFMNITLQSSNTIRVFAYLPNCTTTNMVAPNCSPNLPIDVIIWEDSIPVDTLPMNNCDNGAVYYSPAIPGKRYDATINDLSCNCTQSTWEYNPPKTFLYATTDLNELNNNPVTLSSILSSDKVLDISYASKTPFKGVINIYSFDGKLIKSIQNLYFETSSKIYELDVNSFKTGIYFMKTFGNEFGSINKFLIY